MLLVFVLDIGFLHVFLVFVFCKVTESAVNFLFFWVNVFVFVGYPLAFNGKNEIREPVLRPTNSSFPDGNRYSRDFLSV